MVDISNSLEDIMKRYHCSPIRALIILKEGETSGVHLQESKPVAEINRGLCDTCNFSNNRERVGGSLS